MVCFHLLNPNTTQLYHQFPTLHHNTMTHLNLHILNLIYSPKTSFCSNDTRSRNDTKHPKNIALQTAVSTRLHNRILLLSKEVPHDAAHTRCKACFNEPSAVTHHRTIQPSHVPPKNIPDQMQT